MLVIPAIAALAAANYEGKDRAFAYGIIGGVAGAAIAVGPVIGGWVTTNYSWRLVFVGEVVIVIAILLVRKRMQPAPRPEHPPRLDFVGAALSAAGLGLIVFGILQSSKWGWLQPLDAPTIGGNEITPLGFSLVPFLIVGGVFLLWFFSLWEERRERLGQDTLLERALLRIESLRAGLATLMSQQLVLMGTFFVLPVYLQVVLGLDAFETGKRLLPMSVTMLIAALAGPKLAARLAPRLVVQIGLAAMVVAALVLVGTIDVELNETGFKLSLALFGVGAGLMMSQLGNVIMSSAPPEKTNEAGGLQGTAQNLGASLGTALIGSVLLTGLLTGFNDPHRREPRALRARAHRDHGRDRAGDRDRHDRAGARRCDLGRPQPSRGGRRHGRLRRRPARRTEEGDARGGAPRAPLAHVHAPPAGQTSDRRACGHTRRPDPACQLPDVSASRWTMFRIISMPTMTRTTTRSSAIQPCAKTGRAARARARRRRRSCRSPGGSAAWAARAAALVRRDECHRQTRLRRA